MDNLEEIGSTLLDALDALERSCSSRMRAGLVLTPLGVDEDCTECPILRRLSERPCRARGDGLKGPPCPVCGGDLVVQDMLVPGCSRIFWCVVCSNCHKITDGSFESKDLAFCTLHQREKAAGPEGKRGDA